MSKIVIKDNKMKLIDLINGWLEGKIGDGTVFIYNGSKFICGREDIVEFGWLKDLFQYISTKDLQNDVRIKHLVDTENETYTIEVKAKNLKEARICPVCSGKGVVMKGFYNQPGKITITWAGRGDEAIAETCRSCGGKGYIEL